MDAVIEASCASQLGGDSSLTKRLLNYTSFTGWLSLPYCISLGAAFCFPLLWHVLIFLPGAEGKLLAVLFSWRSRRLGCVCHCQSPWSGSLSTRGGYLHVLKEGEVQMPSWFAVSAVSWNSPKGAFFAEERWAGGY